MPAPIPVSATAPAFHRRVKIVPRSRVVSAWVEDDYHHMGVALYHDSDRIARVDARIERAPWTTCPGAAGHIAATFDGVPLGDVVACGEKPQNCTHLYDMVLLAAAHASDDAATRYDIMVTDAVAGVRTGAIARDDVPLLSFEEQHGRMVQPAACLNLTLFELGTWIATLDELTAEAARLLRWAAIVAHGRAIPMDRQSDAGRMPPVCYTFQPTRRGGARRTGEIRDFSTGPAPLEGTRSYDW